MGSAIAIRHQNYLASVLLSFLGTGGLSDCWDSVLWQNKREDDRGKCPAPQTGSRVERGAVVVGGCRNVVGSSPPPSGCALSCRGKSLLHGMCSWRTNSGGAKKVGANTVVCLGTHWDCCTGLLWTGGRWPLGWGKPKLTALSNIGIGHVWSNKQQLRKRWIETIAIQSVCLKWLIR